MTDFEMVGKRNAPMHNGRPHKKCGTTLKYSRTGNCVHCGEARNRTGASRYEISEKKLAEKDAEIFANVIFKCVRIERRFRIPLEIEIPIPPPTLVNRVWLP